MPREQELKEAYSRKIDSIKLDIKPRLEKARKNTLKDIEKLAVGKGTTNDRNYRDSLNNILLYINKLKKKVKGGDNNG